MRRRPRVPLRRLGRLVGMVRLIRHVSMVGLLLLFARDASADCTVSSSGVAFGSYNIFDPSPLDSTGTITVDCTGTYNSAVIVKISAGASSSFANRKLMSGGHELRYNLYREASHTTIWGDGSSSTDFAATTPSSGTPFSLTVFGRIPDRQTTAFVGSYSDSPVVTVEF